MRGSSLKLTLGIGLLSLVALGIPACGDDDETTKKPGTGGTGGKDGGTGGSTGGAAGAAGSSGSGGSGGSGGTTAVVCGGETCKTYKVANLFDVGACCKADKCGADLSATVGGLIGLPAGCYETNVPGNTDSTCPELKYTNPLDGGPGAYSGCCNHNTKKCGYSINLTSVAGPNAGCLDATGIGDSGAPAACTPAAADAATD